MADADLLESPLQAFHARHGARFVPFAGWSMPVQYATIQEEHRAVREAAGLFDVSHMAEFFFSGDQAGAFLDRLLVNAVDALEPGRAAYSPMCRPDGGVVDDVIVYRQAPDRFLMVANAANREKDWLWIADQPGAGDIEREDASDRYALLALQGPRAVAIFTTLAGDAAGDLPRFGFAEFTVGELSLLAARTGYTGEDGYELLVGADQAEALADRLMEAGADAGLLPAGLGARDSLRLEAGLPLYGHELADAINPLEAGLGWTVKWKKPADFNGREALAAVKEAGPARRVRFFIAEDRRTPREGMAVVDRQTGAPLGAVLSGSFSPMIGKPIGSALIHTRDVSGHETGLDNLAVDVRGRSVPIRLAKPPLHRA
ncbi:MAG: glycine cleavage system aminomethyltransferase GcvT [Opitutales bacterium]